MEIVEFDGLPCYNWVSQRNKDFHKYIPIERKHVIIFGQSKQGKSSTVNLMLNKEEAPIGINIVGETFQSEPYWDDKFCYWDTAGLNENDAGVFAQTAAAKALIQLLKLGIPYSAAIMVCGVNTLNNDSVKRNFVLFYETFLEHSIPFILAITMRDVIFAYEDEGWLQSQELYFEQLGFKRPGEQFRSVCLYSKPRAKLEGIPIPAVKDMWLSGMGNSRNRLRIILEDLPNITFNPSEHGHWTDRFRLMWNKMCDWFVPFKFFRLVNQAFKDFLKNLGFSDKEAHALALETEKVLKEKK